MKQNDAENRSGGKNEITLVSDIEEIEEGRSSKGSFFGTDYGRSIDSDRYGVRGGCRTSCGMRTVRVSVAGPAFCDVFHVAAVYFRRGCGTGGRRRNRLTRNAKFPEMVKLDLDLD